MTYDQQLRELRIVNLIARHNGIGTWAIGRHMGVHMTEIEYWLRRRDAAWGIYEDDDGKLYLTWHHGGMAWRLPGGVAVDSSESVVV